MKTKNKLWRLVAGMIILVLASCYDDKGNYDYHAINQIGIRFEQEAYEVNRYEELTVAPLLTFTQGEGQECRYSWILEKPGTTVKQNDTLSNEKILKKVITAKSGTYNLCLAVTDPETGVTFRQEASLAVKTELTQGYILLCEKGGKMALDMLTRKSLIIDGKDNFKLLKNLEAGLPVAEKPLSLRYSVSVETDMDTWDDVFYHFTGICTENAMIHLDENLEVEPYLDVNLYASAPFAQPLRPQNDFYMGGSEYFFANGDFYFRSNGFSPELFGAPANSADESYQLYPDMMAFGSSAKQALYYDITNRRFVYFKSGDFLSPFLPEDPKSEYFNIDKEMLYMCGPRYGKNGYAVTRDPEGNYIDLYVYTGTKAADALPVIYPLDDLPGIHDARFFDIPEKQPYLFYATETEVYQLNYDLGKATLQHVYSAAEGKKIVRMKFNRFTTYNSYHEGVDRLLVCVNGSGPEDSCGELHIFSIAEGNVKPVEFGSYSGIAKIVDVAYKEQ